MKKPDRIDNEQAASSDDIRRLRLAFDSLGLVDSGLDKDDWIDQVREQVGADTVAKWRKKRSLAAEYNFTYSSFEKAKHFSAGWRSGPLAAECEWMLHRLRDAITRSGQAEPFLVEIGAGAGAAAAVLSAALEVPVIAVDSHPKTLGMPEQFAQRTGGRVTSRVADIADLAGVLDGASPAAVFGLTVYRHFQPHQHGGNSFSYWFEMQRLLASHEVDPHVDSFIAAMGGADLVLSEVMCTDFLAEMAAGLFKFGYEIPQGGMKRITGSTPAEPTVVYGIHFTKTVAPKRNPNLLIEMCSPLPRPYADFASDPDNDPEAEALRLSLEPTEFIDAAQVDFQDGSGCMRHEVFGWGKHLIGQYVATTGGYRNLKFFPRSDLESVLEGLRTDEAELEEAGAATVYPCRLPASQWGGPLDT